MYTNLLQTKSSVFYVEYFSESSFISTYDEIIKTGTYTSGTQRGLPMYCYGSTLGRTNYPCYYDERGYHNLPRPYAEFKPYSKARNLLDQIWFTKFVQDVEDHVIYFLRNCYPYQKKAKLTLFLLTLSKKVIPNDCRICGSCFNHMTLLGKCSFEKGASISPHRDEEDIITALFHLGKPTSGGATIYYSGVDKKDPGKLIHTVPFEHGRLQIGFYNETVHAAGDWEGIRGGINLNLKRNVLNFFRNKDLKKYYKQYENAGFPKGSFVAF